MMGNYRNKRSYENLEKYYFKGVGEYGIPQLAPTQLVVGCEFIPFNYALSTKNWKGKGVHFFLDDYQFNRLWTCTDRYIKLLSKFEYVMTPDFSIYADLPKAVQIYNHYRKHWVGAYLQRHGIRIIPTISWGLDDSFEWCFTGEPLGGCVAVSSVGCMDRDSSLHAFMSGYHEMISRLQPVTIIFHGKVPDKCEGNIIRISAFQDRFKEINPNGR